MAKNLVIVESPTKSRTISRFLGSDFMVDSSYGHIRDLPTSKLGIDTEHNFEPTYVIPQKARANVKRLKEAAQDAEKIILATDEDREGEAIAWHLVKALGLENAKNKIAAKPTERIVFHEITKKAIEEALNNPRGIDQKLVDAQQARRILDRLVGYKLSPFLWKKVSRGLSAGRVQSVAVRLIVEREREIQNFKPEEYWSIEALLKKENQDGEFVASLIKIGDRALDKMEIKSADSAQKIAEELKSVSWVVENVEKKATTRNPLPPFTTSTLQQEAWRRFHFSAKQTMMIAQQLYEGIELEEGSIGLITYMRTDSVNLSRDSLDTAKNFISQNWGENYSLSSPRVFKTKVKGAQEAHEAIRPTDPTRTPESIKQYLNVRQYKLYDLIWRRFMASQMPEAIFESTAADISAGKKYLFRANGIILKFDGFLKIYQIKFEDVLLPALSPQEMLELRELLPQQHFTDPRARYTEASLVKALEKFGIGRPSTYAPTMSTIQERGYITKDEKKKFIPTEIGTVVNDILVEHFPKIVDVDFTAKMEEELDEIAQGKTEWQPVIREFYEPFAANLSGKYEEVKKHAPLETTDEKCDKCGRSMVVRLGRFGKFLACSGFPECKNTKTLKETASTLDIKCPKCGEGEVVIKRSKRGKIFYGCSRYPECDFASWQDPRKTDKPGPLE